MRGLRFAAFSWASLPNSSHQSHPALVRASPNGGPVPRPLRVLLRWSVVRLWFMHRRLPCISGPAQAATATQRIMAIITAHTITATVGIAELLTRP
jgi:hypothetical protein